MFQKIATASRYLLGVCFTVFGANGLMMAITGQGFIPAPPPPPEMMTIMTGFMATHYLMGLVALLQFVSGVIFLAGRYVNAGIVFLGPIVVNILLIHIFAEPTGLPVAIVVTILYIILVKSRWEDFRPLVRK
jgi:putative oxidoreductase